MRSLYFKFPPEGLPYSQRRVQVAHTRSPEGLRLLLIFRTVLSARFAKTLLYTRRDSLSPETKVSKCRAAVRVSVRVKPTAKRLHCRQVTSR